MTNQEKTYSVIIDIFQKGTYKIYSIQLTNGLFKAIKLSTNNKSPEIIVQKNLTIQEAREFENYMYSFPIDSLENKYINDMVRGAHHLVFHIRIGEKKKDIQVYFQEQEDLKLLFQKLNAFIPEEKKLRYY